MPNNTSSPRIFPSPPWGGSGRGNTSDHCFIIYTLGCKANQAVSDVIAGRLISAGCKIAGPKEKADICIINTCTVTGKASHQSRQAVRKFIKNHAGAKIIVTGCDAEFEKEALQKIKGVDLVVGTRNSEEIIELITKIREHESTSVREHVYTSRSRPFIRIEDGCDSFCTYCIVPHVRGPVKSEPPEAIIKSIADFQNQGYHEIVLTGIHIGKYGYDLKDEKINLVSLVKRILNETEIGRIRLSSVEPDELDSELISVIATSGGRICPHLHVPLQSGSDKILSKMKRRYTTKAFRARVEDAFSKIENISIGTDVITGFPGETDANFAETVRFIDSLPLTYLHVFTYSERSGTPASVMPEKVAEPVKRERTKILRDLSATKRAKYLESNIGREVEVVFDKRKIKGYWKGVSGNYINVLVDEKSGSGSCYKVLLLSAQDEKMTGRIV